MKIKYIIIIIIVLSLFFAVRESIIAGERNDKDKYNTSFKGVVVKKVRRRGDIIFYKNFTSHQIGEIYASGELQDNSIVGDTIVKLENSNRCILKNGRKNISLKCYFNLDDIEYFEK